MEPTVENCFIGKLKDSDECHKTWYVKQQDLLPLSKLKRDELELLEWRSGVKVSDCIYDSSAKVCLHHHQLYIKRYEKRQTKCCNLFQYHSGIKLPKARHCITLHMAKVLARSYKTIIPGHKLCVKCYQQAKKEYADHLAQSEQSSSTGTSETDESEFAMTDNEDAILAVNSSLQNQDLSPLKLHAQPPHQKAKQAKQKLCEAAKNLQASFTSVGINISPIKVVSQLKEIPNNSEDSDLKILMHELKSKFKNSTYHEKIQILTLKPASWTTENTMKFFDTTKHSVKKAINLKKEEGILSKPMRAKRKGISSEDIQQVLSFFEDDEFSRPLPGKKDYVSVRIGGEKQQMQKRLLLGNLSELFEAFKKNHPTIKLSFARFCSLRPKWCKVVGSPGGHNVCVCQKHQNSILACLALDLDYKSLMKLIVCNTDNRICMVHRCESCPGKEVLLEYLKSNFDYLESDDKILFQQWRSTDRSDLENVEMETDEYFEFLTTMIDNLTIHSYISKSQARYLKQLKNDLNQKQNVCIVLADFSENYTMTVQDEIQSFHFHKPQCTLHPLVLYLPSQDQSLSYIQQSIAFFSDDLNHDTSFVFAMQEELTHFLKVNYPFIKTIEYFSDGCAGQYKNYKNFINLTYHEQDFGLAANWNFFTTSHGKSSCDGIGGAIKRKLTHRSLTQPYQNQILTAKDAYIFCKSAMPSILFHFLAKENLSEIRQTLNKRYAQGHTIPGTRSYHVFSPECIGSINFKTTAEDERYTGCHKFFEFNHQKKNFNVGDYVAVKYDHLWWIGLILEFFFNDGELLIKFMHPHGPRQTFYWPKRDDILHVPIDDILLQVSTPNISSTGRVYQITDGEYAILSEIVL